MTVLPTTWRHHAVPGRGGSPTQGSAAAALELSVLAGAASRVEINLFPGELVAREIEVETEDDEEKIESRVSAINPTGGTITLELGGLVVSYGDATRFRTEAESQGTRAAWEAAVQRAGRRRAPDGGSAAACAGHATGAR